jgi:Domain of unknown function (DUF222)/HNH endonuclease
MCDGQYHPSGVVAALAMLDRALDHLATVDAASLPTAVQAEVLRALERAGAKHTATRGRVLAAFAAQAGYEDDGHGSARTWLKWQARVTAGAAAGAVGWARRLAAHPVIGDALAAGDLSESWAREICGWTDRLPEAQQDDADEILAGAARGGADLPGLAGLAREMYERSHRDGSGDSADDGFADRSLWLGLTFGGAGRLAGDLTPGCSAALSAVLEALGKRAGSEDLRTAMQRRHDALEEACRRLIRSGMLPGRAGQPTQVLVHMTLGQLRGIPGASPAEDAWAALRASQPGWLTGPDTEAAVCDATVVPIVTGHVDWAALDMLTEILLAASASPPAGPSPADPDARSGATTETSPDARSGAIAETSSGAGSGATAETSPGAGSGGSAIFGPHPGADLPHELAGKAGLPHELAGKAGLPHELAGKADSGGSAGCRCRCGGCTCLVREPLSPGRAPLSPATRDRLRRALLGLAADALSGPDGFAARLRAALDGKPLTSVSLPLDIGAATETIPAHLRRAVTIRHPHCAFPGCDQPASVCDIHHIVPRSRGGPTALHNLVPLCGFHHQIAIHRWGWELQLNNDGTTAASSPDRTRTLHSHGPPRQAA